MSFPEPTATADPLELFVRWCEAAERGGVFQPDAVALATVAADGRPSVRMVLYKGLSGPRLRFFTNYESRKASELDRDPRCALVFHWKELQRQVRVEGDAERLPAAESAAYFRTRPRDSQLGALISPQSRPIADHEQLMAEYRRRAAELADREIDCPPHWGGYGVVPRVFEFWTAHAARLHERHVFARDRNGSWRHTRLAP